MLIYHQSPVNMVQWLLALVAMMEAQLIWWTHMKAPFSLSQLLYMISISLRLESVAWSSLQLPEQRVGSLCLQILFLGAQEECPKAETGRAVSFHSWNRLWAPAVQEPRTEPNPAPALEESCLLRKGTKEAMFQYLGHMKSGIVNYNRGGCKASWMTGR